MENEERGMVVTSYSVTEIKTQVNLIQELMKDIMQENEHYGLIPGTKKMSLYKPGAEKLSMVFRLAPSYKVVKEDLGDGHREMISTCKLIHIPSGAVMGEGVGSCSTMESKYRYRNVSGYEILDEAIPNDAKENKVVYRKQGFGMQKIDGDWFWVKYGSSERQENPDIADVYNTVLKISKKRSHTDAILTVLAASDIFTQDYDEEAEPPPPEYDSEASVIVNIRACNTVESLKYVCSKFKDDYAAGITGMANPSWKRIVVVMEEMKNKLDSAGDSQDGKPEEKSEPAGSDQGDPPEISDDDMPAFMQQGN